MDVLTVQWGWIGGKKHGTTPTPTPPESGVVNQSYLQRMQLIQLPALMFDEEEATALALMEVLLNE